MEKINELVNLPEEEIERFKTVWKKAVKKCFEDEKYILICPEKYGDFVYESKIQKNCLVRCNYYEKMASGNSYIYFLRKKDDINMPFITIEYNPKVNKVYQCYLANNKSPSKDIKDYVVERLCGVPC